MTAKLVTITGSSGSGKTTLVRKCQRIFGSDVAEAVSVTTRPKRPYELDAIDYYFVTEDEFKDMDFLETTEFNGYHYGTNKGTMDKLLKNHKVVFAIVDHRGAETLKSEYQDILSVFVHASKSLAFNRVKNRDGEEAAKERKKADAPLLESESSDIYDIIISTNGGRRPVLKKFLMFLEANTDLSLTLDQKVQYGLI